jgi:nucleotide-binding universal stress UspA family protein
MEPLRMVNFGATHFRAAVEDFRRARRRAELQEILARVTGKSVELLPYDEVARKLRASGGVGRGRREIPLDAIVGSVGRYTDFTRTFLPRQDSDEQRWARVKALTTEPGKTGLPPIEVYQIGEAYFVLDGHHRVSAARQLGATHIEAYVTEVRTRVPLSPDVQPDDLILKAEYAGFLEYTRLDQLRPGCDLSVSVPGQYRKLEDHIEAHRYLREVAQDREMPYDEAVCDWYDHGYLPVVQSFREHGILRHFPGRTETDLYVWVTEHRTALEQELGWKIKPEVAASALAARLRPRPEHIAARVGRRILEAVVPEDLDEGPAPGTWRKEKLADRYSDRLFADILVPVSGEASGWQALDQALELARREGAQLHGLHVVPTEAHKQSEAAQAVREAFNRRCAAAGLTGLLAIEVGEVTRKICERGLLADLIVLNLAHPPPSQPRARLESGFRTIIRRCARPVLAVPGPAFPIERALLAYDGSAKAEEALFVAAYLGEQWQTPLVVLTIVESGRTSQATLDHARAYLEMHEISATFVSEAGPIPSTILTTAAAHASSLILMGGYGASPVMEVVLGSSVDAVLRETRWPVFVCR